MNGEVEKFIEEKYGYDATHRLQKEAGLSYHKYDAEMEERFTGWATTNIEIAWQILRDAGYYRPERA